MRKIVNNVIVFDDAIKCEKCGTLGAYDCTSTFLCGDCMPRWQPGSQQRWVMLRCPECKQTMPTKKEPSDPTEAVVVELHCPECLNGGWEQVSYYDKTGKEIAQHNDKLSHGGPP